MGLFPQDNDERNSREEGGYKRFRDVHAHDHHDHGHCQHDHSVPLANGIRGFFQRAAAQKPLTVFGATAALLATTALTAPLLATTLGAGMVMVAALAILPHACHTLIESAESIGKKFAIPAGLLGMGIAAMESIPEFAVAAKSIASGAHAISMGNIVGSNIAHVLLILGTVAAIAGVKKSQGTAWKFNVAALAGATTAFGTQLVTGRLIEGLGYGMMAAAAGYVYANFKAGAGHHHHHHDHSHTERSTKLHALYAAGAMGSVIYTAHTAVDHAQTVALNLGAPEVMVGTLALAIGTAAPEFAVNITAARQGKTEMAVGNIIGCSVLNLLAVGGVLAATGAPVPEALQPTSSIGLLNMVTWGVGTGLATAALAANKGGLKRWHGFAALTLYGAYLAASIGLGAAQNKTPVIPENIRPSVITPV